MRIGQAVLSVRTIAVSDDLVLKPGVPGHVVETTRFRGPKAVRFSLHNDAGKREVTVRVRRGDVA